MPKQIKPKIRVYFSEHFQTTKEALEGYGTLDISLVSDLPLFIDPFLLFNSKNKIYQVLHGQVIEYLRFLREKSSTKLSRGLLQEWFFFREVSQTWLGFSKVGNKGRGLAGDFAESLNKNLGLLFGPIEGSSGPQNQHMETLCLIEDGVGRDNISDFTTNLIKEYLCGYTEAFSIKHLPKHLIKKFRVDRVRFNYATESWEEGIFTLPCLGNTFVLLTPVDLLTKDETWINRPELLDTFNTIVSALPDAALRAKVDNYIQKRLKEESTREEVLAARSKAIEEFPAILGQYVSEKEKHGAKATLLSRAKVTDASALFIGQAREFAGILNDETDFYCSFPDTYIDAHRRAMYMKRVIEKNDGYRLFYFKNEPIQREADLQILYRMTWFASINDFNSEVNNGRGPVDFKVSQGAFDKTLVEMKLASNKSLKKNLRSQVEIYKEANETKKWIKIIMYFTYQEKIRTEGILKELGLKDRSDVILIDARRDNKPSASKAGN